MENIFQTVLECMILTSDMSLEYFHRVTAQSKKISVEFSFRKVRRAQVEKRHCSGDGHIIWIYASHDHIALPPCRL